MKERLIDLLEWMNDIAAESPMQLETDNDDIVQMYLSEDRTVKNNGVLDNVSNQRELLLDFAEYSEEDKTSTACDECVDNYLDQKQ